MEMPFFAKHPCETRVGHRYCSDMGTIMSNMHPAIKKQNKKQFFLIGVWLKHSRAPKKKKKDD